MPWLLDQPDAKARSGIKNKRLEEKLGWLREFTGEVGDRTGPLRSRRRARAVDGTVPHGRVSVKVSMLTSTGVIAERQNRVDRFARHRSTSAKSVEIMLDGIRRSAAS